MFFGLTNSPATFQNMINKTFRDYIDKGWMVVYMDDILVFSKDKADQEPQMKKVLQ
jgi:hypothetical protein